MPISTKCPHCNAVFKVRDDLVGRTAKCAQCHVSFTIAAESAEPPEQKIANPLIADDNMKICPSLHSREEYEKYRKTLLTPLQTPLPLPEMTTGYRLGLVLLVFFLFLLPLVYVGIIAGLIAAEYYYFASTWELWLEHLEKGGGKAWAYFIIPTALAMVILVMLKPLIFGWWGGKDTRFEITREREPLLFEFIDHICSFVGAPVPHRVFIDCDVNASVGLSYGIRGAVFGGNDCDLTIGLPLVAGLNTSEFAGVLAHEFGHFTQSETRRMTYIVRTLLGWFAHIYYYRDRMDVWLATGTQVWVYGIGLFCLAIQFFIWLVRRVIWCIMMLGNLAAGYMSRQMEYDADSFQVQLIGSERFAFVSRKIILLDIAKDKTITDLNYMLNEERLADNLPLLIAVNSRISGEDIKRLARKIIKEEKGSLFGTHPIIRDRIEAARNADVPGVLHVNLPASLLFRNFLGLSRELSIHFYREVVELTFESEILKNSATVIEQFQREGLGQKAVTDFFQRTFPPGWFLPLPDINATENLREMTSRLQEARKRQKGTAVDAYHAAKEYEKAKVQLSQATMLRELVRIGAKADFSGLDFRFRTLAEGNRTVDEFSANLAALAARMSNRDIAAAERLVIALHALKFTEVQNRIEDGGDLLHRMETLAPILQKIGSVLSTINEVDQRLTFASIGLGMLQTMKPEKAQSLWETILEDNDLYRRTLREFQTSFSSVPYPFEHGKGVTLGEFLVPTFSDVLTEPLEYVHGMFQCIGRLHTTYRLALGEVAAIALAVEDALDFLRLPVPPPEDD